MSSLPDDSDLVDQDAQEQQLADITASIIAMAQLDFSSPPPTRGDGPLDAVAVGLMALGEELQASVSAQHLAEKANEAKADFLANMSHELRTPLTTILGSAQLLADTQLNPEQTRHVQRVREASSLLQRLISDVLDFSKIEAGALSIEPHPFRLRDCLRRVIESHREPATTKNLRLTESWSQLPDIHVRGNRIEQVLHNLVGNAVKYTQTGTIHLAAEIETSADQFQLTLDVQDSGPGIAPELSEKIFERFTMGDSSIRRRQSGAGLGLSISRSLVEAMGGTLTLDSEVGKGSIFRVRLTVENGEQSPPAHSRIPDSNQTSCRVLVVDDTDLVRHVTADMLAALDCTVDVAESGHEAIAKVAFQDYDLILMDCQMPLMDGLETTQRLLDLNPERNLQIVAITAHSSPRDEQMSQDAGMVAHLTKPYNLHQLQTLIQRFRPSTKESVG